MLVDSREISNNQVLTCDLCIIGAGAAGITIARSFLASGHSVCLMESGGFTIDAETQDLYRGWVEFQDQQPKEDYSLSSRLRYFGGTTNHWAGWCKTLDPIDFSKRDWVEHSGWPINELDLKPYYAQAAEIVEIEPFRDFDNEGRDCSGDRAIINSENICSKYFHFSPPTRFGRKYRKELVDAENVRVCINANARMIALNEKGDKVDHVEFETLTGVRFTVDAKVTVLATGGVENARILLYSDSVQKNGIGNSHDQVGRYFMDHPHYPNAANIVFTDTPGNLDKYDRSKNTKSFAALGFTNAMQRKNRLLNTAMQIERSTNYIPAALQTGDLFQHLDNFRKGKQNSSKPFFARMLMISELNPDPENRVLLDREVDKLGLRKSRLILNLTEQHLKTITKSIELFSIELAKISNGRLRLTFSEDDPTRNYFPAYHHSGTTRMSETEKSGVVDSSCKVHGVANLYVAGSSIFPTTGFANPTFTIVALGLRLSDHIKNIFKRG